MTMGIVPAKKSILGVLRVAKDEHAVYIGLFRRLFVCFWRDSAWARPRVSYGVASVSLGHVSLGVSLRGL